MKNKFKTPKDIFTSDKPNYYKINDYQDLLDLFTNGLLTKSELRGFYKGVIIKYLVRFNKKGQAQADLNKLVMYTKKLRSFELNKGDFKNE